MTKRVEGAARGRPSLPEDERRVRVDVRLRPALLEALDGLAASAGESRTETLERVIERAVRAARRR